MQACSGASTVGGDRHEAAVSKAPQVVGDASPPPSRNARSPYQLLSKPGAAGAVPLPAERAADADCRGDLRPEHSPEVADRGLSRLGLDQQQPARVAAWITGKPRTSGSLASASRRSHDAGAAVASARPSASRANRRLAADRQREASRDGFPLPGRAVYFAFVPPRPVRAGTSAWT